METEVGRLLGTLCTVMVLVLMAPLHRSKLSLFRRCLYTTQLALDVQTHAHEGVHIPIVRSGESVIQHYRAMSLVPVVKAVKQDGTGKVANVPTCVNCQSPLRI